MPRRFTTRTAKHLLVSALRVLGSVLLVSLPVSGPALSQNDPLDVPLVPVEFRPGDTIRTVVDMHLNDPNLWPTVLALNNIASPVDLRPGMRLLLPVGQVRAADAALRTSLTAIQSANAEGAGIFAPVEIGQAIENRDLAVGQRSAGAWRQVVSLADLATEFAGAALELSIAQRDRAAEAIVSDVQGKVEGRAPTEPAWSGRQLDDILVEFERVRTLSASTTQITFRDLSRLRLNPNSNATIQRMRSDPLTGGEVTKVTLANGDFYALLNQLTEKTTFEIDVPGLRTRTNSADFWIKNDDSGARFVNYDSTDLEIAQGTDRIVVGKNEGVVIADGKAARAPVLSGPVLRASLQGETLYTEAVSLRWEPFPDAKAYWLEVASDPAFNVMKLSQWGVSEPGYAAELPPDRYFWRVAALDQLGLPGAWSTPRGFSIREDNVPPYLALLAPSQQAVLSKPDVLVLGATEANTRLLLNGEPLEASSDGTFEKRLSLEPGKAVLSVTAVDPAGNRTTREVTVFYRPTVAVTIALDADLPRIGGALATRAKDVSVSATTNASPGAEVLILGGQDQEVLRTRVLEGGALSFSVPASDPALDYRVEVLSPDGAAEGQLTFAALRDRTPPEIILDAPVPLAVGEDILRLEGHVGDAVSLLVNGDEIPLNAERFAYDVQLVAGRNKIELLAVDAVGNVAVKQLNTVFDTDPPEVLGVEVTRPDGASGAIAIEVQARDESGLRQAAPFVIEVGGREVSGYLRCETLAEMCRGILPPEPGDLLLVEVMIEDYVGNAAFR
ncbi:MAG: hypothetical protein GJ678_08255 [Rhodobacteraceae bacterium]|nr:hypothetical protein [Paracoccaceae bacterium]